MNNDVLLTTERKTIRTVLSRLIHQIGPRLAITAAFLFPLYLYVMCEIIYAHEKSHVIQMFIHAPQKVFFALLVLYISFFSLWLILKNIGIAAALTGSFFYLIAIIQYYKLYLVGSNLYPWDFGMIRNIFEFRDFLNDIHPTFYILFFGAVTLLYILSLFLWGPKMGISWPLRLAAGFLFFLIVFFFLTDDNIRTAWYPRFDMHVSAMMDQNENYKSSGFLPAFFLNAGSLRLKKPEGYSEEYVKKIMEEYTYKNDTASGTLHKPDIIVILAEALWDPKQLSGTTFSDDPFENFDAIRAKHSGGMMITNTFGGGTVRPEFEILTSMSMSQMPSGSLPYLQYVDKKIWSFPRYYKELGYDTLALHPYLKSFYNRDLAYAHMGFDEFKGQDDFETTPLVYKSHYISDETFVDEILLELSEERSNPLFLFGISMENHGLYTDKYPQDQLKIEVQNPVMTEEELNIVQNFSQGIYDFDAALGKLYQAVMEREKETVVLVFGDHLPAMSRDYEPYASTGYISTGDYFSWSEEDNKNMFTTPYLVFSNFDTNKEYLGEGKEVSPFHLLNLLGDYVGLPRTPYLNMLMDFYTVSPVYNTICDIYTPQADKDKALYYDRLHWLFTYDMLKGGGYSLQNE